MLDRKTVTNRRLAYYVASLYEIAFMAIQARYGQLRVEKSDENRIARAFSSGPIAHAD